MTRYRVLGFVVLAAAVCASAGHQSREAAAATANAFTWGSYNGDDGKQHDYPRWVNIQGQQGKVNFDIGQGTSTDPNGWKPIRAWCRVYRQVLNGYETTPYLEMTTDTFTTVMGVSTMTWSDLNNPKKVFDSNTTVMVVITIRYQNIANPSMTQDVVLPAFYVNTTAF